MKYTIEYTTTITQEYQEDIEAKSKEGAIALFEDTHDDASENIEIYRVEETKDEERKGRIDYLRKEIQEERISTEEILELQSLKDSIPSDDVELLQWAGVEENI